MKKNLLLTVFAFCCISFGFSQADCANALALTPGTPQAGDTTGQAGSFSDSNTAPEVNPCSANYNDLEYWFQYTAVTTGETLDITVTDLTSNWYGVFVIDNCPDSTPTCVAQTTNGGSMADLTVTTPALTAGTVYYIVLTDFIEGPTTFTMNTVVNAAPSCLDPTTLTATNITSSSADLGWTEAGTATLWNIELVDAGVAATGTATAMGVSNPYTAMSLTQNSDYEFYVQADCGMSDGVSDWVGPFAFSTLCDVFTPDYLADMSVNVPDCWDEAGNGEVVDGPMDIGASNWRQGTSYALGSSNAINLYTNTFREWLLSPTFDLSTGGPHQLDINVAVTNWNAGTVDDTMGSDDEVQLLMSTDGGATWSNLTTWNAANEPPVGGIDYVEDLSAITGNVQFAIFATDGATDDAEDYDFHVGKFQVRATPSCIEPSALMTSNVTASSVDLSWTAGDSETLWDIELVDITAMGTATGTATTSGATNPYTLTALAQNNAYEVYVRADCAGSVSSWVGPVSFTTLCAAFTAPYTEDFENAGALPDCWTLGGDDDWEFTDTGAEHIGDAGTLTGNTASDGYFAWLDDSDPTATNASLISPFVDVSGLTTPALSFYEVSNNEGANPNATLTVEVWDGAAWNVVGTYNTNTAGWELIVIDLSGLTFTGDAQARFLVADSGSFYDDIAIDDVTFDEAPSCFDPSALTASNILSDSADLGWTENGTATLWNIEIVDITAAGTPTGTPTATGVANPYMASGLTPDNDYEFYVQADCGASGTSAWVGPFAFSTTVLCPEPTALNAANITADSANLEWTNGSIETLWDIELVDITASGTATGTPTATGVTNPYMAMSLAAENDYEFYVRADCGANGVSAWAGPFAFTTACAAITPDYLESFDTFIPSCWIEAGSGNPTTGPSDLGSGLWNHDEFLNVGSTNNSAQINLYTTNREDWLLSPTFDLSAGGYELVYTVGLTDYANSNVPEGNGMGVDDEVQVLISTDNGATWINLATYNQSSFPSNTGDVETFDLSAYTGNVQFAIWATDGTVNDSEDYDFFIDEFIVRTPLVCTSGVVDSSTVVDNCASTQFSIDVDVTTVGDATQITDGTNVYPIAATGVITVGPYNSGDTVTLTVEHSDVACNFSLGDFTFNCPPVNDDIAAAVAVTVDEGFCDGTNTNGSNLGSTDSGEGAGSCFWNGSDNDVWFTFTVPSGTASVDISTDFTGGTLLDTQVAVYSGSSGSLTELDCDQDGGTTVLSNGFSWNSLITDLAVTVGETYYIQVDGYDLDAVGTFCLDISTNQVLSIDDLENESAFTYYPNPVKNTLTLNAQNTIENVTMYNMLGQEVLRAAPNAVDSNLDMSKLQAGAYFVKVTIANVTQTVRVIKQ